MHACVQICFSAVPRHRLLTQNWSYVHSSPCSPTGGSQKHLPASHFWPLAQVSAVWHGAPLVIVTIGESVKLPRSSNARSRMSMMLFGTVAGTLIPYSDGIIWPFGPNAAPL